MEIGKTEIRRALKDKRIWIASFLVAWAAALQRQDSFKRKFEKKETVVDAGESDALNKIN
ncbi:hypothetical protein M569_13421 [Genlisea aurea]|uniref:Uncharacterized protein n=1 Tax=Genlisea aurea TaxID=192259 RepID=S8DF52_9LAMI|nr:hypothetical protein M569_13421 [Genlisea aurea]